jgi:hypothetical protein
MPTFQNTLFHLHRRAGTKNSSFPPATCGPGSSVGIVTDYGLDGPGDQIPVGARFFTHVQTGPGAHPDSCTTGTGSFLAVKRLGRGADHTTPSSAEVKNK